ncbi:MAG: bifunctional 3-deoxy-7-phosphoheptulonate synthase/chorismate mutase type II [Bacteroidia bacterium]|nr:bifunctional 3-deoxy-7-phosphoheptulonate synthase/chorismate mutase type II [Bacteroidia bacterium]
MVPAPTPLLGLHPENAWLTPGQPLTLLAGPCSAESEAQLVSTALALEPLGVRVLRMGIWKPRTRPGAFEGYGEAALPWVAAVKKLTRLELMTEVATPLQVELALKAGFDRLWIGARTTVNPFAVQELAEALRGTRVPVLVKNPVNPDLSLWIGALERLERTGVTQLAACHRGFSRFGETVYRNAPLWDLSLELRLRCPNLPLVGDPSHMAGKRALIPALTQQMVDLGYDGLMIEVHPTPESALSDAAQQLTPAALGELLGALAYPSTDTPDAAFQTELARLRTQVDELDRELLTGIAQRQALVQRIAALKHTHGVAYYQTDRFKEVFESRTALAAELGIRPEFVEAVLRLLHAENVGHAGETS